MATPVKIKAGRVIAQRGLGTFGYELLGSDGKLYNGLGSPTNTGAQRVRIVDAADFLGTIGNVSAAYKNKFATTLPADGFVGQEVTGSTVVIPLSILIMTDMLYDGNDQESVLRGYKYHPLFGPTFGFNTELVDPDTVTATTATGGIVLSGATAEIERQKELARIQAEQDALKESQRSAYTLQGAYDWALANPMWSIPLGIAVIEIIRFFLSTPKEKQKFEILGIF